MLLAFLFIFLSAHAADIKFNENILCKFHEPIPAWMKLQVDRDLDCFRQHPISRKKVIQYYEASSPDLYLIKFTIINNAIHVEWKDKENSGLKYRLEPYERSLKAISEIIHLPDMTFLLSLHDAFSSSTTEVPLFSMCKRKHQWAILVPDFEALREKFQVLSGKNLLEYEPSWESKTDLLGWRGSTAQGSLEGELMRKDNVDRFSRVILCKLSHQFPELIDAKFTFFTQGGEFIPTLQTYGAHPMSFEKLIAYKYQLFIDGNVSPYSASGWKFFSNSLVFIADSPCIQWYFGVLKPYEHFVPVRADLDDLVDKVRWAKGHDMEARAIARNCREFALSHLTLSDNLYYLWYVLDQYCDLNFVD